MCGVKPPITQIHGGLRNKKTKNTTPFIEPNHSINRIGYRVPPRMNHSHLKRTFPFDSTLSLKLLIEYWETSLTSGKVPFGDRLLEHLATVPELKRPITDPEILVKHKELLNYLMSAVIAPAQTGRELIAATVPFHFRSFFETEAFQKTIDLQLIGKSAAINIPGCDLMAGKTIQACLLILQQFYNVRLNFDKYILFTVRNPHNGLDKVYKIDIGRQFCEIISKRELRPIDPRIIKFLTEKVYDVDLWLQYIRPEDFEFRGFMLLRMTDVTEQEMVSSMKYDLLEKDAVSRKQSFDAIQQKLRSVFGLPEIKLGLAYFDADNMVVVNSGEQRECWKSLAGDADGECGDFHGSVYERSWMEKRYIAVEDLEAYPFKSPVEEALLSNGIRSILLAPLLDEGQPIGMLELATPNAGELNPITANKVESVLPMFTAAVKREKEGAITEIRAIIQEECTNIHPVVQWRFVEAGRKVLEKRKRGEPAVFEDITFKDVYPLFGMADVRNSSVERTAAIRQDLIDNLQMVKSLLKKIKSSLKLPLLDETLFKTDIHLERINLDLASGNESSALDFITHEIHPLLNHFDKDPAFADAIEQYRSRLDPDFGVVYRKRREFENTLALINNMISSYLNEAQLAAQEMFPHYFEKYQTDGVEYTVYLGSSLTKGKTFNTFFLKNFRLWQLLMSCEIERRMEQLKPQLKVPLDITQLILVHDQPLSIRFRPDEKQFDVDGAYDIRYEIVKKRIDKATIKGTGQRLTQPGKIAVTYNQPRIEEEYKRYFEYLAARNVITGVVEELELEELPGATGLHALRVTMAPNQEVAQGGAEALIRSMELAMQLH